MSAQKNIASLNLVPALILLFSMLVTLIACNPDNSTAAETAMDTLTRSEEAKPKEPGKNAGDLAKEKATTLVVQFKGFSMGDQPHYLFTDKAGKEWDFVENQDTSIAFSLQLPQKKATERNQGFASNKTLEGKWFSIQYGFSMQPQHETERMANLPVIIKATAVQ